MDLIFPPTPAPVGPLIAGVPLDEPFWSPTRTLVGPRLGMTGLGDFSPYLAHIVGDRLEPLTAPLSNGVLLLPEGSVRPLHVGSLLEVAAGMITLDGRTGPALLVLDVLRVGSSDAGRSVSALPYAERRFLRREIVSAIVEHPRPRGVARPLLFDPSEPFLAELRDRAGHPIFGARLRVALDSPYLPSSVWRELVAESGAD